MTRPMRVGKGKVTGNKFTPAKSTYRQKTKAIKAARELKKWQAVSSITKK